MKFLQKYQKKYKQYKKNTIINIQKLLINERNIEYNKIKNKIKALKIVYNKFGYKLKSDYTIKNFDSINVSIII